jgi:hypothetical protein
MQFVLLLLAGWAQSISLAWPFATEVAFLGIRPGQALWWLQILAMMVFAQLVAVCFYAHLWRLSAMVGGVCGAVAQWLHGLVLCAVCNVF